MVRVQITMSSVKFNWKAEAIKWLPDVGDADICIVSNGLTRLFGSIRIVSYDLVATLMKRYGCRRRFLMPRIVHRARCWCLCGFFARAIFETAENGLLAAVCQ